MDISKKEKNRKIHIVLADEPTGALDAKSADNAFELIKELCKKYDKTVILVTHSNELANRSDRIIDLSGLLTEKN